ncbi:MAG: hypothetical protein GY827_04915 [Cytophagales bacterium]|nr:hypothetical protein [Cytophagales bacterium]
MKKKKHLNGKTARREKLVEDGAYDGRFRHKVETLKKHKKVKHKHKLYEE